MMTWFNKGKITLIENKLKNSTYKVRIMQSEGGLYYGQHFNGGAYLMWDVVTRGCLTKWGCKFALKRWVKQERKKDLRKEQTPYFEEFEL
jgi:hypothetical protein